MHAATSPATFPPSGEPDHDYRRRADEAGDDLLLECRAQPDERGADEDEWPSGRVRRGRDGLSGEQVGLGIDETVPSATSAAMAW